MSENLLTLLIKQLNEPESALTPQDIEKAITRHIGERINALLKEIMTGEDMTAVKEKILEKFGFTCTISPELSLYIDVSEQSEQHAPRPSFSTAHFEISLQKILETDFSAQEPASILEHLSDIINQTCEYFNLTVLLSHPLMFQVLSRLSNIYPEGISVFAVPPIVLSADKPYDKDILKPPREGEGFYL